MVSFQKYQYTSDKKFAGDVRRARLAFLFVYEDPKNTSLIETIVAEPDELYLAVNIAEVAPEVRDHLLSLDAIGQKVYQRQTRDIPYLQTFITGMGFFGTAFERKEVEELIARSRADKIQLEKFYREKLGRDILDGGNNDSVNS